MRWILFHLASGDALLSGAAVMALALPLFALARRRWIAIAAGLAVLIGAALVTFSSPPIASWILWTWTILVAIACASRFIGTRPRAVRLAAVLFAEAIGAAIVGSEMRYRIWRPVDAIDAPRIYVIGDSLSSGIGRPNERTWPRVIADQSKVQIIDLAVKGATTRTALEKIRNVQFDDGAVILEIGGNDMFRRRPVADFESDLDRLVRRVSAPGRRVVMFEIPLLPLRGEFGEAQRRVARAHGVSLIPRRHLARVIIEPGSTVGDGIHLTNDGQRRMADLVWNFIGSSLPSPSVAMPQRLSTPAH